MRLITSFRTGTSVSLSVLPPGAGIAFAASALSASVSGSSAIDEIFEPMPSVIIIR